MLHLPRFVVLMLLVLSGLRRGLHAREPKGYRAGRGYRRALPCPFHSSPRSLLVELLGTSPTEVPICMAITSRG
ncbi:protein of unknown function [Paraburkholderia kururiensis]